MLPEWDRYCGWRDAFEAVIDPRYYTMDWLDLQILNGPVGFWGNEKAALIAEIKEYPTGARDVHCLIAAGEMSEIVETLAPKALAWGAAQSCIAGLVESRPGWAKILKPHGWEAHQQTLRKEL